MRKLLAVLTLVIGGCGLAQPAVTTSNANMRAGPATSSAVLQVVPKGTHLDVTCAGTWCKVNGKAGYLAKSVLQLGQVSALPVPALPQTGKGYTNVDGVHVASPVQADSPPPGASAKCRDGSYSFSLHRNGTCSHHGGVDTWL